MPSFSSIGFCTTLWASLFSASHGASGEGDMMCVPKSGVIFTVIVNELVMEIQLLCMQAFDEWMIVTCYRILF